MSTSFLFVREKVGFGELVRSLGFIPLRKNSHHSYPLINALGEKKKETAKRTKKRY